jgi:hypothetical protein
MHQFTGGCMLVGATPHLGIDADTHETDAVELTPNDVGDIVEWPSRPPGCGFRWQLAELVV